MKIIKKGKNALVQTKIMKIIDVPAPNAINSTITQAMMIKTSRSIILALVIPTIIPRVPVILPSISFQISLVQIITIATAITMELILDQIIAILIGLRLEMKILGQIAMPIAMIITIKRNSTNKLLWNYRYA